jgi:hypothetical protein
MCTSCIIVCYSELHMGASGTIRSFNDSVVLVQTLGLHSDAVADLAKLWCALYEDNTAEDIGCLHAHRHHFRIRNWCCFRPHLPLVRSDLSSWHWHTNLGVAHEFCHSLALMTDS